MHARGGEFRIAFEQRAELAAGVGFLRGEMDQQRGLGRPQGAIDAEQGRDRVRGLAAAAFECGRIGRHCGCVGLRGGRLRFRRGCRLRSRCRRIGDRVGACLGCGSVAGHALGDHPDHQSQCGCAGPGDGDRAFRHGGRGDRRRVGCSGFAGDVGPQFGPQVLAVEQFDVALLAGDPHRLGLEPAGRGHDHVAGAAQGRRLAEAEDGLHADDGAAAVLAGEQDVFAVAFEQDVAAVGGDPVRRHAVLDHRVEAAALHRLQHQPGEIAPAQVRELRFVAFAHGGGGGHRIAVLVQPHAGRTSGDDEDQQGEQQWRHAGTMSRPEGGRRL